MKHYEYGYIIAKENEIVSENDITKMNQTVKENLSKYSKYNPEDPSQSAPLYANRIRTWEVLGEEPECEVLYIGEGIEYFSFSCTDKIKKIYIPSSVKEIRKSSLFSSEFIIPSVSIGTSSEEETLLIGDTTVSEEDDDNAFKEEEVPGELIDDILAY